MLSTFYLILLSIDLYLFVSGEVYFESQPTDYTAVIGANAYFNCTYSGYYSLPLWSINGTFYSSLPRFHYQTKFGVTVTNVNKKSNQTTYECIVLNKRSSVGKLIIILDFYREITNEVNISTQLPITTNEVNISTQMRNDSSSSQLHILYLIAIILLAVGFCLFCILSTLWGFFVINKQYQKEVQTNIGTFNPSF